MISQPQARLLALLLPAALLAGAWGFQLIAGLPPCEMCHWQRWPLYAALPVALAALVLRNRPLTLLAALLILTSGAIGAFHAGVEYGWWEGPTQCSAALGGAGRDIMADILAAPLIRCDTAPWSLFGLSLAGWNALFSLAGGSAILLACLKPTR